MIGFIGGAVNFCLQKSRMPMAGLVYFHILFSLTKIRNETFSQLSRLRYLNLDSNQIETMETGSLDGLYRLKGLTLSYNYLTHLPRGLLRHLDSLERLELHSNQLTELQDDLMLPATGQYSLSQPTNQSINQSINEPANQSINQSINK